jgi:DNA-binding response OmpR family regulator
VGNRAGGNRQLLKQLVHRLRQKLEADPRAPKLLRTVPNSGYVLDPEGIRSVAVGPSQVVELPHDDG